MRPRGVGTGSNPSGLDSGTGPAGSATQDTVSFNVTPSIPGAPTTPANGSVRVRWTGGPPSFISTAVGTATLPVAVRSNAGQVGIAATVGTPRRKNLCWASAAMIPELPAP